MKTSQEDNLPFEKLFQFRDGSYVADEAYSNVLYQISEARPEVVKDGHSMGYEQAEMGMAELFSEVYCNEVVYCPERKSWYAYVRGVWKKDPSRTYVSDRMRTFVRLLTLYCVEIEDDELRKTFSGVCHKMEDIRSRKRMIEDAESETSMQVSAAEFDADPYLINGLNGTFDLRTGQLHEHTPSDFLTMQAQIEFSQNREKGYEIRCTRWEQFIDEVTEHDSEKADFLQRSLGYSLLGKAHEECMFILWGKTTRNGKSTLLNTIETMLGTYATTPAVSLICSNKSAQSGGAATPELAALKGVRFVTMAESNQYGRLDEEKIKQLTGGESITARALYESPITYTPQFTMWLSCNDLPRVHDKSIFASDRVKVIEFTKHFDAGERDENLKHKFEEPDSRTGIFNWLYEGYVHYTQQGLAMPECIRRTVRFYERDNDLVEQFLEQYCDKGSDSDSIKAKDLYDRYKIWCRSGGYYAMSANKFYNEMERHAQWYSGITSKHRYTYYVGIKFRENI